MLAGQKLDADQFPSERLAPDAAELRNGYFVIVALLALVRHSEQHQRHAAGTRR